MLAFNFFLKRNLCFLESNMFGYTLGYQYLNQAKQNYKENNSASIKQNSQISKTFVGIIALALKLLNQCNILFFTWDTFHLSASFKGSNHICIKDKALYKMSVGALGNCLSIAILFRVIHKVQAKPAKRNMRTRIGRGPLPCNQTSENSCKKRGISPKLKTSFMNAQVILASTQSKRIWFTVSKTPQRQHFPSPLQPLLAKDCPTGSLLLKVCHRKKNYFERDFAFPNNPSNSTRHTPIR